MTWQTALTQWSLDPAIVLALLLSSILYWRGRRSGLKLVDGRRRSPAWHALSFYAGLGAIILALESPIDYLSASLFTFHMIQHLLLIMVAAPLLILGDPAVPLLRGVPLGLRRATLGFVARRSWVHRLGRWYARLNSPSAVFGIFLADLYLWHWSRLFNLTLQNDSIHLLEHVCFLVTALLFWSQVIDQRTMRAHLSYAGRVVYIVFSGAASNLLAMYFVFAPRPLYSAYADLATRPFGMTALGDQQMAGAVMWVPVLFLFGGAFAVLMYKAIGETDQKVEITDASYSMPFVAGGDIAHPARKP